MVSLRLTQGNSEHPKDCSVVLLNMGGTLILLRFTGFVCLFTAVEKSKARCCWTGLQIQARLGELMATRNWHESLHWMKAAVLFRSMNFFSFRAQISQHLMTTCLSKLSIKQLVFHSCMNGEKQLSVMCLFIFCSNWFTAYLLVHITDKKRGPPKFNHSPLINHDHNIMI